MATFSSVDGVIVGEENNWDTALQMATRQFVRPN